MIIGRRIFDCLTAPLCPFFTLYLISFFWGRKGIFTNAKRFGCFYWNAIINIDMAVDIVSLFARRLNRILIAKALFNLPLLPLTRSTTFTTIHQHSVTSNVPILLKRRINPVPFTLPRYSRFLSSLRLCRRVLPRPHDASSVRYARDFPDINKSYRFIVPADFVIGCTKVFGRSWCNRKLHDLLRYVNYTLILTLMAFTWNFT